MSRRTISLLIIGAVLLIAGGGIGSYLVSKKLFSVSDISQNLSKNLFPSTPVSFSLSGLPTSIQSGQIFTVNIIVSSNENILASDLDINYDTSEILFQNIVPGSLFPSPMQFSKDIDTQQGKIFYALGSLSGSSGNGTVATLSLKALANLTQPKISFGEKTSASVRGDKKVKILLPE